MQIFEIRYPGTWLDLHDRDRASGIQRLFYLLDSQFIDAAVAMNLFTSDLARMSAEGPAWDPYQSRIPFLHAHAFLYAVDAFGKVLRTLAADGGTPGGVRSAVEEFERLFPNVKGIRNSALHIEDRGRGMGRGGEPLALKPLGGGPFAGPGGILILSALVNDRVGYTLEDGSYAELPVNAASVEGLQALFQGLLECFAWKGPERRVPDAPVADNGS